MQSPLKKTRLPLFEVLVVSALLVLGAVTRYFAMPASLWEWDDMQFASAIRQYDIGKHSPHPPGFPVFVLLAKLAFLISGDESRSLILVSLFFGIFLPVTLYYFFRELFRDRTIAFGAAVLASFAPNIWVQGGMGRSDGAGLTLSFLVLTLLLRGRVSRRSFLLGAAVLGLGMGVRITLLHFIAPLFMVLVIQRCWKRDFKTAIAAIGIVLLCVSIWYVPMVLMTGWRKYEEIVIYIYRWAIAKDSIWASTGNEIIGKRIQRFFIDIWGAPWIMRSIYELCILGVAALLCLRQWQALVWLIIILVPYCCFTFVFLNPMCGPLYSMPYTPLIMGLSVYALFAIPRYLGSLVGWKHLSALGLPLTFLICFAIGDWTSPIIKMIHQEASPSIRAMQHLDGILGQRPVRYLEDINFLPHSSFYLSRIKKISFDHESDFDSNLLDVLPNEPNPVYVRDAPTPGEDSNHFKWTDNFAAERLFALSLGRYFHVYTGEAARQRGVEFLSGWYDWESNGSSKWRWTNRRADLALLNRADVMNLRLSGHTIGKDGKASTVTVSLDGAEVDRFQTIDPSFDRNLTVRVDPSRLWSSLQLRTDQTVIPNQVGASPDHRELGIRLLSIGWSPESGSVPVHTDPSKFLGEGWDDLGRGELREEGRWSGAVATVRLPPLTTDGILRLELEAPIAETPNGSTLTVEVDGYPIEEFNVGSEIIQKNFVIPFSIHQNKSAILKIKRHYVSSEPPARAMRFYFIGWRPNGDVSVVSGKS